MDEREPRRAGARDRSPRGAFRRARRLVLRAQGAAGRDRVARVPPARPPRRDERADREADRRRQGAAGARRHRIARRPDHPLPRVLAPVSHRARPRRPDEPEELLLDALAGLLVRIHLAGFFWGDCSLSNTLFRRDAGALAAYVVDVETGELQEQLSDGQRRYDLEIAYENLSYEFFDVAAGSAGTRTRPGRAGRCRDRDLQPALGGADRRGGLRRRGRRHRSSSGSRAARARIRRRGDRAAAHGDRVPAARARDPRRTRPPPPSAAAGSPGLEAQENQARRLLTTSPRSGPRSRSAASRRSPTRRSRALARRGLRAPVIAVPLELRGKRAPAEVFHELLDHRWSCPSGQPAPSR